MDSIDRIKKIYRRYGLDYDKEKIYLVIKKDKYCLYSDNESVVYTHEPIIEYEYGSILTEVANLSFTDNKNTSARMYIDNLFIKYKKQFKRPCIQHYIQFFNDLKKKFSVLISLAIVEKFYFQLEDNIPLENYNYDDFITSMSFTISIAQENALNLGWFDPDCIFTGELFRNKRGELILGYTDISLLQLVAIDIFYSLENNILIKQCDICNRFFLPITRTSEKRCIKHRKPNIEDVSDDEFYLYYRKKYRTMKAREDRSPLGRIAYNSKFTEPWIIHIQKNIDNFRLEGNLEKFKKFVDDSMVKYKPNKGG